MARIAGVLIFLIEVYTVIVFLAVILRWLLPPVSTNPVSKFFFLITEPVLSPIRRRLGPIGGVDLSPLVVWLVGLVLIELLRTIA